MTCLRPHSLDVVKLELKLRCIRILNLHARSATASPLQRRTLRPKGQRDDFVHDFFFCLCSYKATTSREGSSWRQKARLSPGRCL